MKEHVKIYIDGALDVANGLVGKGGDPKGSAVMLGYTSENFPGPTHFTGELDEVCIYARALTPGEISQAMAKPLTHGLSAHWSFDGYASDTSGAFSISTYPFIARSTLPRLTRGTRNDSPLSTSSHRTDSS